MVSSNKHLPNAINQASSQELTTAVKELTSAALGIEGSQEFLTTAIASLAAAAIANSEGKEVVEKAIEMLSSVAVDNAKKERSSENVEKTTTTLLNSNQASDQMEIPHLGEAKPSYTDTLRAELSKVKTLTCAAPIFKPIKYVWAYDAWVNQNSIHWIPDEIQLDQDAIEWHGKLTPAERMFNEHILRNFTQQDVEVFGAYNRAYFNHIQPLECRMAFSAFSAIECVHIAAYERPLPAFGLPESMLEEFLEYKESTQKYDLFNEFLEDTKSLAGFAKALAYVAGCVEGVMLNGSFAALLRPAHAKGVLKGVGQIAAYSTRDENLHTATGCRTYVELLKENPSLKSSKVDAELTNSFRVVVEQECEFLKLAYSALEGRDYMGMKFDDVKAYLMMLADDRLQRLGLNPIYHIGHHPMPWMVLALNSVEHANFFETRATEYAKGASLGTWEDAYSIHDPDLFANNKNPLDSYFKSSKKSKKKANEKSEE